MTWLKKYGKYPILCATFLALGYLSSTFQEVPTRIETVTVEDIAIKQKLEQSIKTEQELRVKLQTAEKTISDLKIRVVEKVRIVYQKDGTTTVDKSTTTDVDNKSETNTATTEDTTNTTSTEDNKTVNTEADSHKNTKTVTNIIPKDQFYLGMSGGIGLTGLSNPGLEFKYRLLSLGKISAWVGAETFITLPPQNINPQLRVSAGISF